MVRLLWLVATLVCVEVRVDSLVSGRPSMGWIARHYVQMQNVQSLCMSTTPDADTTAAAVASPESAEAGEPSPAAVATSTSTAEEGIAAGAIKTMEAPLAPRELTPISELQVLKKEAKPIQHPEGSSYIMCSSCKTAYVVTEALLGRRGTRVRCGVCDKEWYQSGERLMQSDGQSILMNMTDTKVMDIRKSIAERNWPKYPRVDKIGIFVGNLPYDYTEKEIGDIFGEYGITAISLVRDPAGLSKGFAFLELANEKDVEVMIKEMHLFHVDAQRKLTVRIASNDPRGAPREPREGGGTGGGGNRGPPGGGQRNFGGPGGGDRGPPGGGGGRSWTPRK